MAALLIVTGPATGLSARLSARAAIPVGMVRIPAGTYRPLYAQPPRDDRPRDTTGRERRPVASFAMDVYPVTNAAFLTFVREHPEWRRSHVSRLFADTAYLRHWKNDLELGPEAPPRAPVVFVSWFAARAYLKTQGKTLPSTDQWEYVAAASETRRDASRDPAFLERLRAWYAKPTPPALGQVGSTFRNAHGVSDLHGLVWEWTLDFNAALVTGESRADSAQDRALYCGSGAAGASDFEDYAAFMRYAFRSSLEGRYNVANLGFRGVAPTAGGPRP